MREPNFSESQLQQAANTAFVLAVAKLHGVHPFAFVPSLLAEFDLGWDTAFFLPWLAHLPIKEQDGCNLFIQYKLSHELNSANAKEWSSWKTDYMRFKIPHNSDDYHQWDALLALARCGYPTYYATNRGLLKEELIQHYNAGTLLSQVPMLDIRSVKSQHKHVTFLSGGTTFRLHSELEECPLLTMAGAMQTIARNPSESFQAGTNRILDQLIEIAAPDSSFLIDLLKIKPAVESAAGIAGSRTLLVRAMLVATVRKHIGAHLVWLPRGS